MPKPDHQMVQTMDGQPTAQFVSLFFTLFSSLPALFFLSFEFIGTFLPSFLTRIVPNLRSAVYCSAMAAGDEAEWDFAWSQYKKATLASEASKLMSALACTNNTQLLQRSNSNFRNM